MQGQQEVANLAADMAQALDLLKASQALYGEMLDAVRDNVAEDGTADVESLLARFNAALTGYARRDLEIKRLLARYAADAKTAGGSEI